MLRILPLADDLILPQARQEIYFFNRIDPELPSAMGCFGSILLKKSVFSNSQITDRRKRLFCALLREIRVRIPLRRFDILISGADFSVVKSKPDCFQQNRSIAAIHESPFRVASCRS
jgi:hypothetical protein